MSMRIMARSSSNRNCASARASSVLPTPVGPRKMKLPIGQLVFQAQQLLHLAFEELRHRNAGSPAHDRGNILLIDLFFHEALTACGRLALLFQFLLQLGEFPVL